MQHKPRVAIIIQARMTSTRLPGKVLLKLGKKTVLEHVIDRCRAAGLADDIVVAAPDTPASAPIQACVAALGDVVYLQGDEDNVLERYCHAARQVEADVIVRVTSDCPVVDSTVIAVMINQFLALNAGGAHSAIDYYSNGLVRTFPRGVDLEIFTRAALENAYQNAKLPVDKEHVTRYLYTNPQQFKLCGYQLPCDFSHWRLTLDDPLDYQMFEALFQHIHTAQDVRLWNLIRILNANPHIAAINASVAQKQV